MLFEASGWTKLELWQVVTQPRGPTSDRMTPAYLLTYHRESTGMTQTIAPCLPIRHVLLHSTKCGSLRHASTRRSPAASYEETLQTQADRGVNLPYSILLQSMHLQCRISRLRHETRMLLHTL